MGPEAKQDGHQQQTTEGQPQAPISEAVGSHDSSNGSQKEKCRPRSRPRRRKDAGDWVQILFNGLVTLFTGGLLWLSCDQLEITRRSLDMARDATEAAKRAAIATEQAALATADQVKVAQDTLNLTIQNNRLDQRPWIFVLEAPAKIGMSEFGEFPMKVINNGRTPAYVFETSHACKAGPLPAIPQYDPTPESMIVPPGPTFTARKVWSVRLGWENTSSIVMGTINIGIGGEKNMRPGMLLNLIASHWGLTSNRILTMFTQNRRNPIVRKNNAPT